MLPPFGLRQARVIITIGGSKERNIKAVDLIEFASIVDRSTNGQRPIAARPMLQCNVTSAKNETFRENSDSEEYRKILGLILPGRQPWPKMKPPPTNYVQ
jgi:hypothetical protein